MKHDPSAPGKVLRLPHITREMVRADRSTLFVFGDNMARTGFGGQAAAMRGEPNAVGVPTKWRPERDASAYFTDASLSDPAVRQALSDAFAQMKAAITGGRNVVIPAEGLGTGLAELPTRAPRVHAAIERAIARLEWD